ncbi:MAG: cbb3-type cytochrome c oxidase subunit I [Verrucomicrobiota bacterium]
MSEVTAPLHTAQAPVAQISAPVEQDTRPAIDRSIRSVVTSLFATGVVWLLLSTLLSFVSAIKLQYPAFLNYSFLSYGRVTPAADFTLAYGWSALGLIGVAIWVLMRLSKRVAIGKGIACLGVGLWNLGLLIGTVSILVGEMRPFNGLEMPLSSAVLIFAGFSLVALWILLSLRVTESGLSIGALFIVGGLLWFGWSFLTGNLLTSCPSMRGATEQVIATWVSHGFIWLFLAPVALGVAYFLIPKVTGQPLYSGPLGRICFWLYFLVGGLTCMTGLSGGPIPLWLQSVSAAATILLLVPVAGSVFNLLTTASSSPLTKVSPAANFTRFGLVVFVSAAALSAISSFRSVSFAVHFTLFPMGVKLLLLQGFVGMVVFGAIYFIMPRLSGCEWISSSLIKIHFLCAAYGAAMGGAMLVLSGTFAGIDLADSGVAFSQSMQSSAFFYWGRTLSFALLGIAYAAFTLHFLLMVFRIGQPEGEATLLKGSHGH